MLYTTQCQAKAKFRARVDIYIVVLQSYVTAHGPCLCVLETACNAAHCQCCDYVRPGRCWTFTRPDLANLQRQLTLCVCNGSEIWHRQQTECSVSVHDDLALGTASAAERVVLHDPVPCVSGGMLTAMPLLLLSFMPLHAAD